jgi:hypothetical protein
MALDIGHIDIEYEWFLKGTCKHEPIPTKFNNEYPNGENVEDIADEDCLKSIIAIYS